MNPSCSSRFPAVENSVEVVDNSPYEKLQAMLWKQPSPTGLARFFPG